ncbi:MAG: type II toxin-antitoxin system prevent-host-death family antitoxin [Lachnospiraceae bacterium]|nr:type II toxin-antitoxin system prevent-host-death family antitoxin [bacterium]MDY5516706.1 type II toxin-antitoxin system prevent-host-death family antitoxin [Lachnospiraceae bacterium]
MVFQVEEGLFFDIEGKEVIVTKKEKEVGHPIPTETTDLYLADSLTGILCGDHDMDQMRAEDLRKKYEITD